MEITKLLLMVLIGGMIGYITNKVAIKMLFRPINPVNILGFKIQGVFPKRKDQMAESLADTIQSELLSIDVIFDKLLNEQSKEELKTYLKDTLATKIEEKIPPMAKMFLGDGLSSMVASFFEKDGDVLFDEILDTLKQKGKEQVNIHDLVKERIDALDFVEFEKIIFGLMNRELRHIEVIGLILGSMIGFVQYFITLI